MRFLAKYMGNNAAYTKGAKYQITVLTSFIGHKVKVIPFNRMSRHQKPGAQMLYADLSAFFDEWSIIENQTSDEDRALLELETDDGIALRLF